MNNIQAINELAKCPDVPVIVKDGDILYQVQSIQSVQGFVLVNLGGPVMRSVLQALSNGGEPVGLPEGVPDLAATTKDLEALGVT